MKTNNSSFLSEAAGDEKKAEWLEYNLKLIPETVEKTKAQVAARGAKILMAIPSLNELLEASLPEAIENEIIATASSVKGVKDIHNLKTRRNGISAIIDAHIVVDPTISVTEAHDIATEVEDALSRKFGNETQVSIHIEPDKNSR